MNSGAINALHSALTRDADYWAAAVNYENALGRRMGRRLFLTRGSRFKAWANGPDGRLLVDAAQEGHPQHAACIELLTHWRAPFKAQQLASKGGAK